MNIDRVEKWSKHWQRWEGCRLCPLHSLRSSPRPILGRGQLGAEVVFVCSGINDADDAAVSLLSDAGGLLLLEAIEEAGGSEKQCSFMSLTACRSIGEPVVREIQACEPRLLEATRIKATPSFLVFLGEGVADHFPTWHHVPRLRTWHPREVVADRETFYASFVRSLTEVFNYCERNET